MKDQEIKDKLVIAFHPQEESFEWHIQKEHKEDDIIIAVTIAKFCSKEMAQKVLKVLT